VFDGLQPCMSINDVGNPVNGILSSTNTNQPPFELADNNRPPLSSLVPFIPATRSLITPLIYYTQNRNNEVLPARCRCSLPRYWRECQPSVQHLLVQLQWRFFPNELQLLQLQLQWQQRCQCLQRRRRLEHLLAPTEQCILLLHPESPQWTICQ
jgi:hypothetical protein